MSIVFNPFNPLSYVNAWSSAATSTALGMPNVARGTPIPVQVKSDDAGLKVSQKKVGDTVEVSFGGKAQGPKMVKPNTVWGDFYGAQPEHKVVSLDLALSEVKTTDAFGQQNFTEKNKRAMVTTTVKGQTGREVAETFARQINQNVLAFRAEVKAGSTADSAKLIITRR